MEEYSTDYTIDELMIVCLARELKNGDRCANGAASPLAAAAALLAKMTNSPELVYVAGGCWVDPQPLALPKSSFDWELWHRKACAYLSNPDDLWPLMQRGFFNIMFHRGAQIDAHGNLNGTVIGNYKKPTVRLSGGGGMGDTGVMISQIKIWSPIHDKRTFVEKLDFVTCPGYLTGNNDREKLGLKGGPDFVVTNLAVMDFHEETRRMRLRSIHPGVNIKEVIGNTGFKLIIPEKIPETEPPIMEHVELIRNKIDPLGRRKLEFG